MVGGAIGGGAIGGTVEVVVTVVVVDEDVVVVGGLGGAVATAEKFRGFVPPQESKRVPGVQERLVSVNMPL